ncbi:MAG: prephenate dehydratase [Bacilli bacterium]|nr:prephenate dehydratase [Bacilli bacterium]
MIGYLGPRNSFTYFAATTFYVKSDLVPYSNLHRLFEALENDEVIGIVVPIENSIEGSINEVLDKLLHPEFHINREIVMDIELSLISKNNDLSQIKHVMSNMYALAESRKVLKKELGNYKEILTSSTSSAIIQLNDLDDTYAAIGSKKAIYGDLNILLNNISDSEHNTTRFVFITKTLEIVGFHNKVSIVCAPKGNIAGALYDILHEFAIRKIDLSKIESRTKKNILGEYVFYLDFYGNIEQEDVKAALEILQYKTSYLKIIGSYYSKRK